MDLILPNGRACAKDRGGGERTFCQHQLSVHSRTTAAPICSVRGNGLCLFSPAFDWGCLAVGSGGACLCHIQLVDLILSSCFSSRTRTLYATARSRTTTVGTYSNWCWFRMRSNSTNTLQLLVP